MDTTPFAQTITSIADQESLRDVYLQRLERLLRLRNEHEEELNRQGLRLLDRSIFAAYCACREVDIEREARGILHDANIALQQPIGQFDVEDFELGAWQEPPNEGHTGDPQPEG